jgi:hypothetical protein
MFCETGLDHLTETFSLRILSSKCGKTRKRNLIDHPPPESKRIGIESTSICTIFVMRSRIGGELRGASR